MISPRAIVTIDREVGSRICWLLTIVRKLIQKNPAYPFKPKKILFLKVSEMGTTILAHPAIQAAQHYFPGAKIYVLTFTGNDKLIKLIDNVPAKRIFAINIFSFRHMVVDIIKVIIQLRREQIDAVIDLEFFSRISAILTFAIGSKAQAGFHNFRSEGLYRGDLYSHKVLYNQYLHTSMAFLSLVESLRYDPAKEYPLLRKPISWNDLSLPRYKPGNKQIADLWSRIQDNTAIKPYHKLVIFNTRGGDFLPIRRWPKKYFVKLGKQLLKNPTVAILVVGMDTEWEYNEEIVEAIGKDRCSNFSCSLTELLTLFSISHLLITHDSGPAHFATLTPIYIVSLFGPETPKLYSPLSNRNISLTNAFGCDPCVSVFNARQSPCTDNHCMMAITVEKVYKIAKEVLAKPKPKRSDKTAVKMKEFTEQKLPF